MRVGHSLQKMKETSDKARLGLLNYKSGAAWLLLLENKDVLNFSGISKTYFDRSAQWMMQRLHGYRVNGKKARFTECEYAKLSEALRHIAQRLIKAADEIDAAAMMEA